MRPCTAVAAVLLVLMGTFPESKGASPPPARQELPEMLADARALLRDLVAIDTSAPNGSTTPAAERAAAHLRAAGLPTADVQVIGPDDRHRNLVARLRGRGKGRPVLFLAHLDTVPAARQDWTVDPFALTERDGYYYGRGTSDDKQFCAIWTAVFARLVREGFVPDRDLVLALTAGEEQGAGPANGVQWLLAEHPELVDAEYVLNGDAGGGAIEDGRYVLFGVQAAEKVYVDFTLEVTNPGGHSSRPVPDNAIYDLSRALGRVEALEFPVRLNDVTRPFFERMAAIGKGPRAEALRGVLADPPVAAAVERLSAEPYLNAVMRTTCVATQLDAGHAPNALPQRARANVNCRMLPGDTVEAVSDALKAAVADADVHVTVAIADVKPAPPVQLDAALLALIEGAANAVWPGVPVVPVMETGGTDGVFFRERGTLVYGLNHFENPNDSRAHGRDERIGVKQFDEAARFGYELTRRVGRVESD